MIAAVLSQQGATREADAEAAGWLSRRLKAMRRNTCDALLTAGGLVGVVMLILSLLGFAHLGRFSPDAKRDAHSSPAQS